MSLYIIYIAAENILCHYMIHIAAKIVLCHYKCQIQIHNPHIAAESIFRHYIYIYILQRKICSAAIIPLTPPPSYLIVSFLLPQNPKSTSSYLIVQSQNQTQNSCLIAIQSQNLFSSSRKP